MAIIPTNRARAALTSRSQGVRTDRGRELLSEALQLQQATREHSMERARGRRRKDQVLDVDQRLVRTARRHRAFMVFLSLEACVALVAVVVLGVVLFNSKLL